MTHKSGRSSFAERIRCSQTAYFVVAALFICSAKALQWLWLTHPEIHLNFYLKIVRNQFADVGASFVFALVAFAVFQRRWLAITISLIALNLYKLNQGLARPVFWFDFRDSFAFVVGVFFFSVFNVGNFPLCLAGRKLFGR